MTKQKLMENYTMEQLAGMIITRDREILEYLDKIEELKQRVEESKTIVDYLPTNPIMVASMLINVTIYPVKELRQIAEHLLVYCNANREEEE